METIQNCLSEGMDINMVAMAAMLKVWRRRWDFTLYRIGKEIDMDPHTLSRMEDGETVHSSALLKYIAFIREREPEFDIIKEWEYMKDYFLKNS